MQDPDTVLIILSSRGMVYDIESLRQKVLLRYPNTTVFFRTTRGQPLGIASPSQVDLLIDFTGPRQRQCCFYLRKLRKSARLAVGRNAGCFRKRIYDRVFDENAHNVSLPADLLERERFVQGQVLALAGISLVPRGGTTPDLSKTIALELPPLARR